MKVVILSCENTDKIIEHFIAYGHNCFIVFSSVDREYYLLNGIDTVRVNGFSKESTRDKLMKIKGSLKERFFLVYSPTIIDFDLEKTEEFHKSHQCITTLIEKENKLCSAILETEIFDYLETTNDLEKETFVKIGQDTEIQIYN